MPKRVPRWLLILFQLYGGMTLLVIGMAGAQALHLGHVKLPGWTAIAGFLLGAIFLALLVDFLIDTSNGRKKSDPNS